MKAPRNPRYESLDVLRGIACLAVVAFHAGNNFLIPDDVRKGDLESGGFLADWLCKFTSGLWIGVPLFFAISGYCIAAAADSTRRKPNPGRLFFTRRFRRIYPPLWAFLGLSILAFLALPSAWFPDPMPWAEFEPGNWFGTVTLTEEWRSHFGGPPRRHLMIHLWTLCYEEQFYLVAGLIVLLAPRYFFHVVVLVTIAVFIQLIVGNTYPGFFFDGMWIVFATGVAVYYRVNYATTILRRCIDLALLCTCLVFSEPGYIWTGLPPHVRANLIWGCGFALLLGLLHRYDAALTSLKLLAPVKFCGHICYSLYLVHAPIVVYVTWNCYRLGVTDTLGTLLITLPLGMGLSILAGWAFHRLVEVRFLNPSLPSTPGETVEPTSQRVQAPRFAVTSAMESCQT